ncbi:hypothetical protein VHUM_04292 [Vanrija humicola]|uniref:Autophagy-related protein 13 n=1 Tax=Vanrija humicola TaxID=5417 RepID=A0A7D8UVY5_VANHU|nr:hypothetical protein VHUM_04292 [Vanrija humicola]
MSVAPLKRVHRESGHGTATAPSAAAAATGGVDTPQRGGSSSPASASASVVAGVPNADATSSASSSQIAPGGVSRADQIVYRFYLKTVSVLVDGRVTHLRNAAERKKDRWFNLTIPDTDVHKRDLAIYRSVSTSHPPNPSPDTTAGESRSTVPPLLISLILDTNDIPPGQTLLWNRDGQRVALDPTLVRPAAQPQRRPGIVLERWTFRATDVAVDATAGASDMAPPTAYRLGIIHFRAVYSFVRLLPAYRLFRRLKRASSGLRLGIKLWAAEGYANSPAEIAEAWEVMDRDLIGIDVPLERMIPGAEVDLAADSALERYDFPTVDLFGSTYELGVVYRSNVDFDVEDMESVLSERFVDMDEEWFTPTVARHRLESEARVAASAGTSRSASRAGVTPPTVAGRVTVPPARTGGVGAGSGGSSGSRQVSSRAASGSAGAQPGSLGAAKWGALAEGLPFASGSQAPEGPPSPVPSSAVPYRRLSAHSLQPFRSISASPSTSILRTAPSNPAHQPGTSTPQAARAIPGQTSSPMARTSSFLSQSGRSFTHAQAAVMQGASPAGGAPPFALQPSGGSPPLSQLPSSLSFSKQAVGRGPAGVTFPMASPFLPSSLDRDSPLPAGSQLSNKRHSSSLSGRRAFPGSSPGDSALPPGLSLRRTSTRESGLRHSSIDGGGPDGAENEDVHAFLRALDSWAAPTSIQGHGQSPKVSTSGLGSSGAPTLTTTAPIPRRASAGGAAPPDTGSATRTPLTKAHVGDVLRSMKGSMRESYSVDSPPRATPPPMSRDSSVSERVRQHSGVGTPGGVPSPRTGTPASQQMARRVSGITDSGTPGSSVPRQSSLLSAPRQLAASPLSGGGTSMRHAASGSSLPRSAAQLAMDQGHARSLPGAISTSPQPMTRIQPASVLSPQTTGGASAGTSVGRRTGGPVLIRGGFGAPSLSSKASTSSSSPSHSPVRDYRYRSGLQAERERLDDEGGATSGAAASGYTFPRRLASNALVSGFTLSSAAPLQHPPGNGNGHGGGIRRTAPSSLGAFDVEHEDVAFRGSGRGRVASEGSGSPANQFPAPFSPVGDGLMARLALVQQGEAAIMHEEEEETTATTTTKQTTTTTTPEPPAP